MIVQNKKYNTARLKTIKKACVQFVNYEIEAYCHYLDAPCQWF